MTSSLIWKFLKQISCRINPRATTSTQIWILFYRASRRNREKCVAFSARTQGTHKNRSLWCIKMHKSIRNTPTIIITLSRCSLRDHRLPWNIILSRKLIWRRIWQLSTRITWKIKCGWTLKAFSLPPIRSNCFHNERRMLCRGITQACQIAVATLAWMTLRKIKDKSR